MEYKRNVSYFINYPYTPFAYTVDNRKMHTNLHSISVCHTTQQSYIFEYVMTSIV